MTYLFGVANRNGTVERIVTGAAHVVRDRRAFIPWIVFGVAALPSMAEALGSAGVALAVSATVVDATPFSTVGALAVANASEAEREWVYRGLLAWGAVMVVTAPVITLLVFVLPAT